MNIGDRIKQKRLENKMTLEDLGKRADVNKATIQRYESGKITNIPSDRIERISEALGVSPAFIMGWEDENSDPILENITGVILPVKLKTIPILGTISCGKPIFADENYEGYFRLDKNLPNSDFILKAKGDSMIDANIFEGDLVFFRKQNDVDNGSIAAVLIDDEATLKRVNKSKNMLVLQPCNANYAPIIITKEDHKTVRILGQMVGVYSNRCK